MKIEQGFRIPEPRDKAIRWPEHGTNSAVIAIWYKDSAAWLIPGSDRAYGSARELVNRFGNDWHQIYIERVAEASA